MTAPRQSRGVPLPAIIPWLLMGGAIGLVLNLGLVASTPYGAWLIRNAHPFGLGEPFNSVRISGAAAFFVGATLFGLIWPAVRRRVG